MLKNYLVITFFILIVLLVPTVLSCKSGSNVSQSSPDSKSSALYEADPAVAKKPGIQNCYSHVLWQLTGVPVNYKPYADVETEMKRRGYKSYPMTASTPIRTGDVVTMMGHKVGHIGISLYDGTLCHFRESAVLTVIISDGDLLPSSRLLVIAPEKLATYPQDYTSWLIAQGASEAAIQKKIRENSIGFWHQNDSIADVKKILYPDIDPALTIWKLPTKLEITQDKQVIKNSESVKCEAWLVYGPELDKVKAETQIKVFWGDPPKQFTSGTISASELQPGQNQIKASVTIIKPWTLASDAIKPQYIGKDVLLNLEATTIVTVGDQPGFPAISFTGPVQNDAGTLKLNLDPSGKVTGTWQGERLYQGKVAMTFDGSFSGTVQSPSYMTLGNLEGTVTIKEYQTNGSVKTRTGKMNFWGGEIQANTNASSGVVTGYSSHSTIRVDMDRDGKWDNEMYDWKGGVIIIK